MALKAQLSVILKADDVVVAETNDLALWLKILGTLAEEHQPKPAQHSHQGEQHHEGEHHGHDPVAA